MAALTVNSMAALIMNSLLLLLSIHSCSAVYNIASFGAQSDGLKDSTNSFTSAWAATCGSSGESGIYVPPGFFYLGPITFTGPCKSSKLTIQIDGTLVAPSGYTSHRDWIVFNKVDGVSVYGGVLDGRGTSLWSCKAAGKSCPFGATVVPFSNSNNILINGLASINSELYHIVINSCNTVTIESVKITAPGNSPNTDGIHVQQSTSVSITSSRIKTGDDCISIGPGTNSLWIEHVACGPGHGISIGILGKGYDEAGVENVTIKSVVFTGTENVLRIKTWGRPSVGFVRGVVFEHVIMQNVNNPIIIDQNYCPDDIGCPDINSGVKISVMSYNDIQGSSATPVAVNFDCSEGNPCRGIGLQDIIKLTYGNAPAESTCKYADGTAAGLVVPPSCL